jgi:hypothetical protein
MPGLFLPRSRPWLLSTAAERRFEVRSCKPTSRGRPSSVKQLRTIRSRELLVLMAHDYRLLVAMPNLHPEKQPSEAKNANTLVAFQTLSGLLFRCSRNAMVGSELGCDHGGASVPERGCSRFREKPDDFVELRASNRVGKKDRLWHSDVAPSCTPPLDGSQGTVISSGQPANIVTTRVAVALIALSGRLCDNPTRILTGGVSH